MDTSTKDTLDYYCPIFKEVIAYIEDSINQKSYSEISKGLEIKYGLRYESIRVAFGKYLPSSLNKYIKRRILTRGYFQVQSEQPTLNKRSTYFGLRSFIRKFEKEFAIPFIQGYTGSDLQEVFDIDEIIRWHHFLSNKPYIEEYNFITNTIQIKPDDYIILKGYLSLKAYLLPVLFSDFFSTLDDYEALMFLEINAALKSNNYMKTAFRFELLEIAKYQCKLYDFSVRNRIGIYYIFSPEVPEYLYDTYKEYLRELLPRINSSIPQQLATKSIDKELKIIVDSSEIDNICKILNITEDQAALLIWRYLKIGYLRLIEDVYIR